jgi:hypothetical protein
LANWLALLFLLSGCHSTATPPPPPAQYAIPLTIHPAKDALPATEYNVYCAPPGGTPALMNSAPIAGTSFTATEVTQGVNYTCYATALVDGLESPPGASIVVTPAAQ